MNQMDTGEKRLPRVVMAGFASCFGCQINITNIERHLMEVLGQIDMLYWQLTSSDSMPEDFDVAVIEGAITTKEAEQAARELREKAKAVITIGACANTAGIPGMAANHYHDHVDAVYGSEVPAIVKDISYEPRRVRDVIDVDFEVACCPADPYEFVKVLHHALHGSNIYRHTATMCGQCKQNEKGCFFGRGILCMGLVTRSDCGAKCTNLGRPCNGCGGLSPDANIASARRIAQSAGIAVEDFDRALSMFNETDPALCGADDEGNAA